MTIRTKAQKAMLRDIVNRWGGEPVTLPGWPRRAEYNHSRTAGALVRGGYLELTEDGYRATPAGVEWVARDQDRDALGRRRGGPRPNAETIARARQLVAERGEDGRRKYSMQEVAELVGVNRNTLTMYLYPERHKRRLEQRRKGYKRKQEK